MGTRGPYFCAQWCLWLCACVALTWTLLGPSVHASTVTTVVGAGGSLQSPLFMDLSGAFSLLDPAVEIEYEGITQRDGVNKLLNGSADFVGSDYHVFNAQDLERLPSVFIWPIFACNWGFAYNIPGMLRTDPSLILSRELLSDIYKGTVTMWNDPAIVSLNPLLASKLPAVAIQVGLREDAALATTAVGAGLLEADPWWRQQFNDSMVTTSLWPAAIMALPNRTIVTGNLGMLGFVTSKKYSFAYGPFSYLVQFPEIRHAKMINKAGTLADPKDALTLASVMLNQTLKNESYGMLFSEITDPPQANSWPYSTFSYVAMDINPASGKCAKKAAFLRWIRWFLTSEDATAIAHRKGFVLITGPIRDIVLAKLATFSCTEDSASAPELLLHALEVPLRDSGAYLAVLILDEIFYLIGLVMLVTYVVKLLQTQSDSLRTKLELIFTFLFILSTLVGAASAAAWYVTPSDTVCTVRVWLLALGATLLLASIFTRLFHLYSVFKSYSDRDTAHMKRLTTRLPRTTVLVVAAVLLVQVIILVLWTTITPIHEQDIVRDPIYNKFEKSCGGNFIGGWLIIELIFAFLMLGFSIYTIYLVWHMTDYAAETRVLLIMTYNMAFVLIGLTPIVGVAKLTDDNLFYMCSICFCFCVCGCDILLFWKKLANAVYVSRQGSSDSNQDIKMVQRSLSQSANNSKSLSPH